jgi:hypothetical protein
MARSEAGGRRPVTFGGESRHAPDGLLPSVEALADG